MTTDRRFLIAGNWKMNGTRSMARELAQEIAQKQTAQALENVDLLVCPPFTAMETVETALGNSGVNLGAQTCHTAQKGAHTGDISPEMLKDAGCKYVILGHSERRTDHNETDGMVQQQAIIANQFDLTSIICVGETETQRESGDALNVVRAQILASVPTSSTGENTVIAYEPVWAIGTGKVATPDDVQAMHADIRSTLSQKIGENEANKVRILYGGSMKPNNAPELLALQDVDGGLIGGASLNAEDFWAIAQSCPSI